MNDPDFIASPRPALAPDDGPLVARLWKPWFVHRPSQLFRRALTTISPPLPGYRPLRTSWGVSVRADPTKMIGRSILTTGLYDLTVSEALARLVRPGDTVVDAGANVGYMTLLASAVAGPEGLVLAFEPHPDLFSVLEQNVASARTQFQAARTELHNEALGEEVGRAGLVLPANFDTNDGIARISADAGGVDPTLPVSVTTLDGVLGESSVDVLKLDVEGFELHVLRGATRALESGRIRHIVFEDHEIEESEVVRFLQELGYGVCSLGWSMQGLVVSPVEAGRLAKHYEAPNFVASTDRDEVLRCCRPGGWRALSALATNGRARP